jgi:hypothetical protein
VNPRRYCSLSCFVHYLALRVWPANYLPKSQTYTFIARSVYICNRSK